MRYAGERQAVCDERADPRPAPNEVLIKMQAAGICGSDLHSYRHPDPRLVQSRRVPGHEPAGVIAEVGADVQGWSVGDRVTAYFRLVCGQCHYCRTGHTNVCTNRRGSYGVGPGTADGAAHDANWLRKAGQAAAALRDGAAVYADRDWLSALAYAYSIAGSDSERLLRQRCVWAQDCLADGQLLLPDTYVIFHVTVATSLRRRSGLLDSDHPWSHPGSLQRLRYFYTWPAQVIAAAHPGLAAALLEPAWHRVPGIGSPQARLRLLRELGTRQ